MFATSQKTYHEIVCRVCFLVLTCVFSLSLKTRAQMPMSKSFLCFYSEEDGKTAEGKKDCYLFRKRALVIFLLPWFVAGGVLFYNITQTKKLDWNLWYAAVLFLAPLTIMMLTGAYEFMDRKSSNRVASSLTVFGCAAAFSGICMLVYAYENNRDDAGSVLYDAGAYTLGSGVLLLLMAFVLNERIYHSSIMGEKDGDDSRQLVNRASAADG